MSEPTSEDLHEARAAEKSLLRRGPFMCTPDHAVDMAYFVSQLELAAERGMDAHDLGDILHRYAGNRTSVDEALVELQEFIDEHKETAND